MSEEPELIEIRISVPDEAVGDQLAGILVDQQLAACVQRVGPIVSTYTWQGAVQRDTEWLLLAKTTRAAFETLQATVVQAHPYEVPEVLAVPVTDALPAYAQWVREQVRYPADPAHAGPPTG